MNASPPAEYQSRSLDKYLSSRLDQAVATAAECGTLDLHTYRNMAETHMGMTQILTAGPLLAAVVTAIFATSKLSSDKAAKTTEFRKAWVESFRPAVATFAGTAHTIFGRIAIRQKHSVNKTQSSLATDIDSAELDGIFEFRSKEEIETVFDKEFESELTDHWLSLRTSYSEVVLHVNARDHGAYQLAEAYVSALKSRCGALTKHERVAEYLDACIETAESQLLIYTKLSPPFERLRWTWLTVQERLSGKTGHSGNGKEELPISSAAPIEDRKNFYSALHLGLKDAQSLDQTHHLTGATIPPDLHSFKERIASACKTPDGAVLLAAYATREYLHDEYRVVFMRGAGIERGIRVIDTAAALMLKETWEKIKEGESSYNRVGVMLLAVVVGIIATAILLA